MVTKFVLHVIMISSTSVLLEFKLSVRFLFLQVMLLILILRLFRKPLRISKLRVSNLLRILLTIILLNAYLFASKLLLLNYLNCLASLHKGYFMTNIIEGIFVTYDRAAERYGQPFCCAHSGVAVRGFSDAILRPDPSRPSDISQHPEDFDLFQIGEYDSSTGIITAYPQLGKPVLQGKQVAIQKGMDV